MAITPYKLCSRALTEVGGRKITSFDDNTAESIAAGEVYDQIVEEAFGIHRWRFARKLTNLSPIAEEPKAKRAKYFELPGDCLLVVGVFLPDTETPVEYDREGNRIACDVTDQITVDHIQRVAEAYWPPFFRAYVTCRLSQSFALSIARDEGMSETHAKYAENALRDAKKLDAQSQTVRRLATARIGLVEARR